MIKQINKDGKRYYAFQNEEGIYPSVSTIISMLEDKSFLQAWKDKVGQEEAEKIRKDCASKGNKIHDTIEKNTKIKKKTEKAKLKKDLQRFTDDFISPIKWGGRNLVEHPMIWKDSTKELVGFGGTTDYIAHFRRSLFTVSGQIVDIDKALIDWKNPLKTKRPIMQRRDGSEYYPLTKYFLQTAAYTAAYNQNIGSRGDNNIGINKNIVVCNPQDTVKAIHIYYCSPVKVFFYWEIFKQLLDCYFNNYDFDWQYLDERIKSENMLPELIKM